MENRVSLTEMKGKNVWDVVPEISPTDFLTNRLFAFDNFRNKDVEISTVVELRAIKNNESLDKVLRLNIFESL